MRTALHDLVRGCVPRILALIVTTLAVASLAIKWRSTESQTVGTVTVTDQVQRISDSAVHHEARQGPVGMNCSNNTSLARLQARADRLRKDAIRLHARQEIEQLDYSVAQQKLDEYLFVSDELERARTTLGCD